MNCTLCQKVFTSKQSLKYHVEHNVCKKYNTLTCNICNKNFSSKYNLVRHNDTHLTQNKTHIDISSQILTNPHKKNHTVSISPHNSLTNSSQALTSPHKTSLGYTCTYCKKQFTRIDNLTRHVNKFCKKCK